MSSSRRLSKQSDTNSEFTLECKAAFLSIYDDIGDKIESKKRLSNVLQQSGRNPTRAALDKYWTRDTESLSFSDFVDICRKEPVTTADDLMKAFRKIDVNGDGYISLDELYKIMNAQGENMSREDVRKMIDEVDENKDGKLDYGEFTNMIMKTTEESKKCSMKVMERKERKKRREEKQHNAATNMDSDFNTKVSKNNETETTSLNVEEVKTPKNIESHLDESDKEQVQGFIETETKEENNFGSKVSLRSNKKEKMAGSVASLRSGGKGDEMGSQRSVRTLQGERVGSQVSVRVTDDLGSKTSLRSKKDNTGSQISLKQASEGEMSSVTQEKQDNMGSKASLRSVKESENAAKTNDMGSKASLRSVKESETSAKKDNMGSKASLRSIKESETSAKKDNMGSKASLRSIKELEIAAKKDNMGSKASLRSIKESEIAAEAKEQEGHVSFKLNLPLDSARSVGEEIAYDDDFDIVSTGRPTPRVDLNAPTVETPGKEDKDKEEVKKKENEETAKSEEKKGKDAKESAKDVKDENSLGSQTSLRSGDKEISAPVPSPRKSVSRLSEDDVPRPSPRVRSHAKGKSPSTKSKDKLPDPKTLQDWKHFTCKGCFFYEEDEIVTHLYSLKLTEDSCVYLSACPIDEPACLNLPGTEPVDTALFVFDSRGKLVTCTEQRDTKGTYSVKCDLSAGEYQVLPYTTGCRFRKRPEDAQDNMKESKLVKTKDSKIVITSAFRKALEDIFDLCDLDGNGTMSRDEFNWFNVRTSGEELGEDEWEVVEEKTELENGEITKQGFIELNEMEAEDAQGDVEDLWITLSSMGMNKGLIMDEACPFRVDVYIEESGRKKPNFKVAGIESLEKKEFVSEICQYTIDKADEPTKIRNMKDLYMYTYRNEFRATIVIDNRSRSNVTLQVNCSKSKNVVSNRPELDHTLDIDPQDTVIAHHLLPKSELSDWTVSSTETIHK